MSTFPTLSACLLLMLRTGDPDRHPTFGRGGRDDDIGNQHDAWKVEFDSESQQTLLDRIARALQGLGDELLLSDPSFKADMARTWHMLTDGSDLLTRSLAPGRSRLGI